MPDPRLENLEQRREVNIGKQVDNAKLEAGSPMYYYCRTCGTLVATLPEDWYKEQPPKNCSDCQPLIDEGLIDDNYDAWLKARGEKPVPR
jgi:hypothetical protein